MVIQRENRPQSYKQSPEFESVVVTQTLGTTDTKRATRENQYRRVQGGARAARTTVATAAATNWRPPARLGVCTMSYVSVRCRTRCISSLSTSGELKSFFRGYATDTFLDYFWRGHLRSDSRIRLSPVPLYRYVARNSGQVVHTRVNAFNLH